MRVSEQFDVTVLGTPDDYPSTLDRFQHVTKRFYERLANILNGRLGFGDGTNRDNFDIRWINATCPVTPNTNFTISHNLQHVPVGYILVSKDRACDVYTGSVAATASQLTLRCTVASAVIRMMVL